MVGSGIFALPSAFGRATGGLGALIAWAIAGVGMLMLAFVFQTLSRRKPELDAGIYAYAKAGFGDYLGFASAVGYWIGCCLADVACLVLIKATLGPVLPDLRRRHHARRHRRGLRAAVGRALPDPARRQGGGGAQHHRDLRQDRADRDLHRRRRRRLPGRHLRAEFLGRRGADLRQRRQPGRATRCWSPSSCSSASKAPASIRATRKIATTSASPRCWASSASSACSFWSPCCRTASCCARTLRRCATPSMAGVMEAIVGPWGKVFISVGLLISVLGNYLSWSLLAAEVLHSAAGQRTMPAFLARENAEQGAGRRAVADQYRDPDLPARHLVRRVRLHARAQDDELDDADSLSAGGRLRSQARLDRRDLRRATRAAAASTGCAARSRRSMPPA